MGRLFVKVVLCICFVSQQISCTPSSHRSGGGTNSPFERVYVDSVVYSNRSIDSLSAVADRFTAEGNFLGQAVSYRELGRAYRNATYYQDAINAHFKGLEASRVICDTLEIVQAMNNIGTAYRRMDVLEEAASWHYQGLTLCEQWSDGTTVGLKNKVVSLNGLGNVFLSMGKDSLAMHSFREALKGETALGSYNGMAINYANIGALFEDRGQIDSARYYYRRSLDCNERTGSQLGISLCHGHFGRLAERDGDLDTAFYEYKTAYDVLSAGPDKWHWLESCVALARISIKKDDLDIASIYLTKALPVAEGLKSDAYLSDIYHLYYSLNQGIGRYKDALKWLEKYSDCRNRLYKERNEDAIFELRAKYEREKNLAQMKQMQYVHQQKERRDRALFVGALTFLLLAVLAIGFLVYSLRLRSSKNRILNELNRTKNNYFTNIAHEFRTPLTIIQSAANSISDNTEDESLKDDASDIVRHSKELLNLVNQVLDIAKMTSGLAPDLVWRKGNIVAFIYGICERNRRYAKGKGIDLEFKCATSSEVEMDFVPDLMVRIVQNLLSNAFKFSERNTVVELSLSRTPDKYGGCLHISVKDQGPGMTPDQIKKAFEPYYQAEGAFRDLGTGLGLSLVKLAAEAMGGSVTVHSIIGKGTEFVIDVPIRKDMAVLPVEEVIMEGDYIPESSSAAVMDDDVLESDIPRILVVEDVPEVARWEMRQLGTDYAFFYASDGAEGLKKAEDIVPDLIITDVMMPVMDGIEMCRCIRNSELLCHIPVIMVTARATHEDRLMGLEAGADAYLEKPYDERELILRVKKLLLQRNSLKKLYSERFDSSDNVQEDNRLCHSVADRLFIEKFDEKLEEAFVSGKVGCEDLASAMCIGRTQLNRKIKAITGHKTTEYILMARIAKAKKLLSTTDMPVGEVALHCGIEDVGYFSTLFRKHVGITPSAFRNS